MFEQDWVYEFQRKNHGEESFFGGTSTELGDKLNVFQCDWCMMEAQNSSQIHGRREDDVGFGFLILRWL